jgi:hypothetical protein
MKHPVLAKRFDLHHTVFEVREELTIALWLRDASSLAEDYEVLSVLPNGLEQSKAVDALGSVGVARCQAIVQRKCKRCG